MGIKSDYGKPLSSKVAEALAALYPDSDEWANRVWSFWARSFHIRLDRNKEILPGDSTEVVEVAFETVVLDEEAPGVIADREFAEFARSEGTGQSVTGQVRFVNNGKAYVDFGQPFEGVLPISNISHDHVESAAGVLHRGDEVTAQVVGHDVDDRKFVLSTQRLLPTPFELFKQSHAKGDPVVGMVDNIGKVVFVKLEGGVDGSILLGDLSHSFIANPNDVVRTGHQIKAEIIDFDRVPNKVSLSTKALHLSKWDHLNRYVKRDSIVQGPIVRVENYGIFVELLPGINGMVHHKEMPGYVDVPATYRDKIGQTVQARVLTLNPQKKIADLSFFNAAGAATSVPPWTQPVLSWPVLDAAA